MNFITKKIVIYSLTIKFSKFSKKIKFKNQIFKIVSESQMNGKRWHIAFCYKKKKKVKKKKKKIVYCKCLLKYLI